VGDLVKDCADAGVVTYTRHVFASHCSEIELGFRDQHQKTVKWMKV
jgi:hypothetical protein